MVVVREATWVEVGFLAEEGAVVRIPAVLAALVDIIVPF
jgi:hypothetical protein